MRASDRAIGCMIRWLTCKNLSVHASAAGEPIFLPSRRKRSNVIWPTLDKVPHPGPDYFAENYGSCTAPKFPGKIACICLDKYHPEHRGWLGTLCRYWKPLGAASFDDLRAMAPPPPTP